MVTHMKTTINIADPLLRQAKALARERNTTLREVVEEALRRHLEAGVASEGFHLRRASFGGRGLRPEVRPGSWDAIRDAAYSGRGG